jgi:hypothetical protein
MKARKVCAQQQNQQMMMPFAFLLECSFVSDLPEGLKV